MAETTGERLRRLRGSRTIAEVAKACGMATSTLAMYEYDKRRPSDENKVKLAAYYKRTVSYIFFS